MKTLTKVYTGELPQKDSGEMASALAQLEVGCKALGLALLHGAQARAGGAVDSLKGKLLDTETSVEKLIARVPAVGPMVAMSMYRATHTGDSSEGLATRPSNLDDVPEAVWGTVYPYLDEIGLRTA
jgi:hypothetical protein